MSEKLGSASVGEPVLAQATAIALPAAGSSPHPRRSGKIRRVGAAVLMLAGIAVAAYFAYDNYRISQLAGTVRQLFSARRYQQAGEPLARWLAQRPGSAEAHYYQAWLALALDQPGNAREAIERAKTLGHDEAALTCLKAIFVARAGRLNEAEPILEQAFRLQSEPRLEVARELAKLYLSTFRLGQAVEPIERTRMLDPDDPMPYLWKNEIASRDNADAVTLIQNYRAALERKPDLDKARLGLAEQLSKARRFDDAEQEYRTYIERNPKNAAALVGLGRNFFQRGDLENAHKYFEAALQVDPRQPDALKELGQIDVRGGRIQQACERLKLLCEIEPYEYEYRYSYAQALKLSGDEAKAQVQNESAARLRKEQDRVLQLKSRLLTDPNNVAIRFEVARWMLENGHEKEGLDWTNVILRSQPRHGPTHRLLADYYRKRGESARGLANYHEFIASTGQDGGSAETTPPTVTGPPR